MSVYKQAAISTDPLLAQTPPPTICSRSARGKATFLCLSTNKPLYLEMRARGEGGEGERERERRSGVICKLIGSASRMELLSSRLFLLQRPLLFHKPQMPFRVYIGLMGGCASCGGVWVTG